jgi:hypothetical protein
MSDGSYRDVSQADFHDGNIVSLVVQTGDEVWVTVEGSSGKRYLVRFEGVASMES